ncbi:MAG: Superoxide dismutase [Gammaproteobacteria bacterium]|jgi:Cu-Zn family superoxide dismutase|nr:Superoxide dismutase [Gammaproteobacteria bacterium]
MKDFTKTIISTLLLSVASVASAADRPSKAIAVLIPTQGQQASGTVLFTQTDKGVEVVADINGLKPGDHGFHIHEYGDCSAPDGTSAGEHFNPKDKHHASPQNNDRHAGDLGNIKADDKGKAHYTTLDKFISLKGTKNIIGRSVIVHADQDDLKTQPSGNAGARIACGVIGIATP